LSIQPTKYRPIGIVRRVDQLGRIVLPKSLRERYSMNEGDPVEIIVNGDNIILEKYRPKCIFCGSIELVIEYKDRYVCNVCTDQMTQHSQIQQQIQ
jgi:transcriptional pleiotropic regulator of transition state genes